MTNYERLYGSPEAAVDAVPVVRCKKCMYCHEAHYENPGEPPYIKRRCTNKYAMANSGYAVLEDGFCSYGKPKGGLE